MRSIVRIGDRGKRGASQGAEWAEGIAGGLSGRVELIQALIPLGLEAVQDVLQQEVTALTGERYARGGGQAGCARWGRQSGSVYLSDHKVSIPVPRVRDRLREHGVQHKSQAPAYIGWSCN